MQATYDSILRQRLGIVCHTNGALWDFRLHKLKMDWYKAHVIVYRIPCRVVLSRDKLMELNVAFKQDRTYEVGTEGYGTFEMEALANAAGSALAVLEALQIFAPSPT